MTSILSTGRQKAFNPDLRKDMLTSATFMIQNELGMAYFSELAGISSEIEQAEYMQVGAKGPELGRFVGKAKPPTITLKRAMGFGGDTTWVWGWHSAARGGAPGTYRDTVFELYGAEPTASSLKLSYTLMSAFPTKVEVAGMKAGGTEVVMQTVTLQCDEIIETP